MKTYISSALIVIVMILMFFSCERIDAGYEGIKVKLYGSDKGVQDVSLVTGRVWYNPFTESVYEYPTFIQTVDYEAFTLNDKDGTLFIVDPTISFYIVSGNAPVIFSKYRKTLKEIANTTIYHYVRDAFRIQMSRYKTDDIVSKREQFENDIQKALSEVLNKEGFMLEQMTSGLRYPDVLVSAINNKNKAVQDAMRAQNELEVVKAEAAKLIEMAKAEKTSNDLKQSSLTALLIQQQFIEKWDGKTPLYGNVPTFFKSVP